ncbi:hypothetical protein WR25_19684 [Diploscapter pachys]|uniref:Uncharacterized protein n=1 Tax=Diploscapter pachys TaxID=2018661 RepID=A0A2A2JVM5_9BILA|nr:hypothetical protein WR25_19684 [Diploscapter pachys]
MRPYIIFILAIIMSLALLAKAVVPLKRNPDLLSMMKTPLLMGYAPNTMDQVPLSYLTQQYKWPMYHQNVHDE